MRKTKQIEIHVNNLVVISDTHGGCKMAVCPPGGVPLADGGIYKPTGLQRKMWKMWRHFWDVWVPEACKGEPFAVLHNAEAVDGRHHGSTTQISQNLADQATVAKMVLAPVVERCEGRFYMTTGTEAHSGPSGESDEQLAESLGAIPDEHGRRARYEILLRLGKGLIHATHHIGTSNSQAYESTAPMKELIAEYTEAGEDRRRPPDVVVRSHRHRNIEIRVPTKLGYGICFCTAGWQLKTPFVYRGVMGRTSSPQIGGSLIRQGDQDLYTRHKVWKLGQPKAVIL